jgi:predicted fused transcriptional regulator/phosphomethylpyrimidine kinase
MWTDTKQPDILSCLPENYREATLQALSDWQAAVSYFDRVSDPDLVEYASFQIEAARRKYECLLRRARAEGASDGGNSV